MKSKISAILFGLFLLVILFPNHVSAKPLDEILNYEINVDVNDDATLNINYHIDWMVLDSTSEGPLSWVKVGIPNSHYLSYESLSDNISSMSIKSSGGYWAEIYFDRKYYAGEVVSFDFSIVQDYMYQVDKFEEGYTVYTFTPGWFDGIEVDNLTIRWNMDKATEWSSDCLIDDGYLMWYTSLDEGGKYTISVTYPNDAYGFDLSKTSDSSDFTVTDIFYVIVGLMVFLVGLAVPFLFVVFIIVAVAKYNSGANFGSSTTKKITRTKVVYFPSCPGCGAVRKEGETVCSFCGRSMVKSEEIIKEDDVKPEDRAALGFRNDGEYRYSSSPNTYVRVHSVVVPRPVAPRPTRSSGSHHSSCAHSSCACACACACAGGGRAGCTNKDFYNTGLKLRHILKYKNN